MARYLGPKNHVARRFGANIFGRSRNPLLKKPNPPGQHGVQRRKKSDYGFQLEEKQKLKACYGMLMEKQVTRAFKEASSKQGNTTQMFIERLECRLDNVVYRLGLARTIFAAQQLVAHGHITVNGKKVDRRSFSVKPGMSISVREKSRKMKAVQEAIDNKTGDLPSYMEFDKAALTGVLLSIPQWEQIEGQLPIPINLSIVCEFLAHQS
ncbi:30S ribosomal protein S4 [Candidatus Clavichlamydia salmonicola]|uniref:30S ribosomal protein S4 n=1 Tax=Candidatus Clavichlamydia salmonicola TaxID=469812 RepID=UPI001891D208|nr:30S ribosomal protein S4 [Candidatus Clavichlamydia salmonicola]MBF5050652.1 30S ribosomal protein S4 [Candidatus Clavichlamydia salmonicola]